MNPIGQRREPNQAGESSRCRLDSADDPARSGGPLHYGLDWWLPLGNRLCDWVAGFSPDKSTLELLSRSMLVIYEVDLLDQWFRCFSIRFLETLHSLNIRLHGVGSVPGFQAEKVTRLLQ